MDQSNLPQGRRPGGTVPDEMDADGFHGQSGGMVQDVPVGIGDEGEVNFNLLYFIILGFFLYPFMYLHSLSSVCCTLHPGVCSRQVVNSVKTSSYFARV